MNMIFKIKLFLYKLLHKGDLTNVKNIVCYLCGNEALPEPLEASEEESLLIEKEQGNETAMGKLIEHNLRLVVYISKKFDKTGIDMEDLISIGSIGLIKAIKTFNLDKNIRLATYASRCIENEILMYIRKNSKVKTDVSLDKPIYSDGDGNELILSDILPGDDDSVNAELNQSADRKIVYDLISHLDHREQEIMILRFGLHGQDELTQKEVAEKLGISQSYISRIEKRILSEMKSRLDSQTYF